MVIGDLEVTQKQLCCCHLFLFTAKVYFISEVRVTSWPWENCVLVIHSYSTSMCHLLQT